MMLTEAQRNQLLRMHRLRRSMRPKVPPKFQRDWPRFPSEEELAELYFEWLIASDESRRPRRKPTEQSC
jgi:hypothetical protein